LRSEALVAFVNNTAAVDPHTASPSHQELVASTAPLAIGSVADSQPPVWIGPRSSSRIVATSF